MEPPPRPDRPEPPGEGRGRRLWRRLPSRLRSRVLGSFLLAGIGVVVLPRTSTGGTAPPAGTLLAVGVLVAVCTAWALYVGIRHDLRLPARVGVSFVAYNVLIVLVKFVLAPAGLYQVNRTRSFDSQFGVGGTVLLAAAFVLLLYLVVFTLLFLVARRSLAGRVVVTGDTQRRFGRGVVIGGLATLSVAGVLGAIGLALLSGAGSQYLDFVFSSGVALVMAGALALTCGLVVVAFRSVADRSRAVVDATALLNLFWLGVAFIVLFHVLWVIYVLVLTSIWPLRVVVPK